MNWLQKWFASRLPLCDNVTLTQRNIYILPTSAGLMLAVTLAVLLLASINYQLSLGYLLTFLLAGSSIIGMHVGHGTLRGMTMNLAAPEPQFAQASVNLVIHLQSHRKRVRYGIGLAILGSDRWVWTDVPALGSSTAQLGFKPEHRGLHQVPALTAETRFPLGTFRVWTIWRPAATVLVYPLPEPFPPPLPATLPDTGAAVSAKAHPGSDYDGVRSYRRGDPLKLIVWKKAAKADELVSRDTRHSNHQELWLDQKYTALVDPEEQLSRLCAWLLQAEKQEHDYGLRLSNLEISPDRGNDHKKRCLEALARY